MMMMMMMMKTMKLAMVFLHAMNEAFEEKLSALKITAGSATQTHGSAATFDFLFYFIHLTFFTFYLENNNR